MVEGHWFSVGSDITLPLSIRSRVFGTGRDATDDLSQQVVVYNGEEPVGTARLWWQDGAFWLSHLGVLQDNRGKGYGDLLIRMLLFKALMHNASMICLATPKETQAFFAKYGFQPLEEPEAGEEQRMFIRGSDVHLSHCGGDCSACGHPSPECAPKAFRNE